MFNAAFLTERILPGVNSRCAAGNSPFPEIINTDSLYMVVVFQKGINAVSILSFSWAIKFAEKHKNIQHVKILSCIIWNIFFIYKDNFVLLLKLNNVIVYHY